MRNTNGLKNFLDSRNLVDFLKWTVRAVVDTVALAIIAFPFVFPFIAHNVQPQIYIPAVLFILAYGFFAYRRVAKNFIDEEFNNYPRINKIPLRILFAFICGTKWVIDTIESLAWVVVTVVLAFCFISIAVLPLLPLSVSTRAILTIAGLVFLIVNALIDENFNNIPERNEASIFSVMLWRAIFLVRLVALIAALFYIPCAVLSLFSVYVAGSVLLFYFQRPIVVFILDFLSIRDPMFEVIITLALLWWTSKLRVTQEIVVDWLSRVQGGTNYDSSGSYDSSPLPEPPDIYPPPWTRGGP